MTTSQQGQGAERAADTAGADRTQERTLMPGDIVTIVVNGVSMGTNVVTRVHEPTNVAGGHEVVIEFRQIRGSFEARATPIDDLELSGRPYNALCAAGITTVEQLGQRARAELLGLRSFGETSLREVLRHLEARGMTLLGLPGRAALARPDSPDERWRALDAERRMRLVLAAAMESHWATASQIARRLGLSSPSKIASILSYAVPRGEMAMRDEVPREYSVTEKGLRLAASSADVDAWELFRTAPQNR